VEKVEELGETLAVLFALGLEHNIPEDIERKAEHNCIRGLQVEVDPEEFGTAKVFEGIAIGVCTASSRRRGRLISRLLL